MIRKGERLEKPVTDEVFETASPANTPGYGPLTRLADLAYRRRGRMVLAWIAVLAATVVVAPRLAGEVSTEFATAASESQAAADLVAERFPGTSGDSIEVVWRAQGGADTPAILARVGRFLGQAERLEGVAVDYEVFLLSRMGEEYLGHGQTSRSVADGLVKTARVITAAAAIMVAVFLALAVSDEIFLKLLGVGMATAILLDATIVRMVLVPALMQLFGRANWWIPRWLDQTLPRFDVDRTAAAPEKA